MTDDTVDTSKLLFPGLAKLYRRFSPFSYAFVRFSAGAVLLPHGVQKLMSVSIDKFAGNIAAKGLPAPTLLAWMTFMAESLAAVCLALGLFTRVAALIIWIQMSVIITVFLWPNGYFWTNRGYEYALLWWLLCIAIFFRGGGRYSLDHYLKKEM